MTSVKPVRTIPRISTHTYTYTRALTEVSSSNESTNLLQLSISKTFDTLPSPSTSPSTDFSLPLLQLFRTISTFFYIVHSLCPSFSQYHRFPIIDRFGQLGERERRRKRTERSSRIPFRQLGSRLTSELKTGKERQRDRKIDR